MTRNTRKPSFRNLLPVTLTLALVGVTGSYSLIQGQDKRPVPAQSPSRTDYALRVSTKDMIAISLKAERISLSTIASDISNKLKVPVLLGRSAAKRPVTTDFKALPLESAMQLLATQVYIDYEINRAPGAPPQPVGIYLNDEGDTPPSINAVVMANSQAMLIEGNTEDGVEGAEKQPEKEEPLKVTFERSVLTVKAKRQPLSVVLYKIANELSIPFEMKGNADEVVDLNINNASLEDAVLRMSPNVRLYVRADLYRMERRPFLMVLMPPKS